MTLECHEPLTLLRMKSLCQLVEVTKAIEKVVKEFGDITLPPEETLADPSLLASIVTGVNRQLCNLNRSLICVRKYFEAKTWKSKIAPKRS